MTLFADSTAWPNGVDATALALFLAAAVLTPALGFVFMALDFRAYWRSLRRALVVATWYLSGVPDWAKRETPASLAALGLKLPCSEEDVKRAYRRKVKRLHPDRGGDRQRFIVLQTQFEDALRFLAEDTVTKNSSTRRHGAGNI